MGEDVAALVLGTRGTPGGRPVGRTALEVIGSIAKPVVVVPPLAQPPLRIGRVLFPRGLRSVRLELRVGRPGEEILRVAAESGADLIALGWNQELAPGRAVIVRAALERGTLPLLLIPAETPRARGEPAREGRRALPAL